jgi:hypothetical protein
VKTQGTIPGGIVNNGKNNYALNNFDAMTEVTSHELAEAVTDPDVGYKTLGWYDDARGEVGDIANGQTVYLNGYAVQRIADKNDQAMTPAGATPVNAVSFVLRTDGTLTMHGAGGLTFLSWGIASVSDQGIDNNGHAMVDVVTTGGLAYEYHEGSDWFHTWTYLGYGARSARAGQGVSYVLFNDGSVSEFTDATGGWKTVDTNVASIDAGTDKTGVNMVTEVDKWGTGWGSRPFCDGSS